MPRTKPFDVYFKRYDIWFENNRFAYLSALDAVRLFIPAYVRGVEIGIGSGGFAQKLGIEVGVEPSRQMRLLAQKRVLQVFDAVWVSTDQNCTDLFKNLREITNVQQFRDGYGSGGFVVVCAEAP